MTEQPLRSETKPSQKPPSSMRKLVLRGSIWTVLGIASNQAIRVGNNIVLTRLLFPEVFGLMRLVDLFILGLNLLSDVGIGLSIIQNPNGDRPNFYNTAWTAQVVRGFLLWIACCLLAYPAVRIYDEPMLGQLLPVAGLTSIIAGFGSTKLFLLNRRLELGKRMLIELGSYCCGVALMIVWAWQFPSVWALVAGSIVVTVVKTLCTHFLIEGEPNRFHWDRQAFQEMQRFGRWIFLGSLLTFLVNQGDQLVLGRLIDLTFLGLFTIASSLSQMTQQVVTRLARNVFFPSYTKILRESPEKLYGFLRKSRLAQIAFLWSVSLLLIFFGQPLVDLFYDPRYSTAGWILRILSLGTLVQALNLSENGILLALGKSNLNTLIQGISAAVRLGALLLGYRWGGQEGAIVFLALSSWTIYFLKAPWIVRLRLWQPEVDIPLLATALGVTVLVLPSLV